MLGILLVDKPAGISSHDAVNAVRRKLATRRVGHAGTLDPAATGLLIIAVGPATRFLQYLPLEPKEYCGVIAFGTETTTQDSEGEVVEKKPPPEKLRQELEEVLPRFRGLIQQVPPMFSAVKKSGKPLYVYARQGKVIERQARTIHVETLSLESVQEVEATFRIVCSGGTYVRTLAHDIGQALGCGAHLARLSRVRVGKFSIQDSVPLEQANAENLVSLKDALTPMPLISLTGEQTDSIREGRAIDIGHRTHSPMAGLLDTKGGIIGVARVLGNLLQPECVIPYEASHD